jgi:hypothetical protein
MVIAIAALNIPIILAFLVIAMVSGGPHPGELIGDTINRVAKSLGNNPLLAMLTNVLTCAAIIAAIWLAGRFLDRRRFADFGFHLRRNWWIDLGFGLALGALLMGLIFVVEQAAGWVTITGTFSAGDSGLAFPVAFLVQVILYIGVGIQEETFSRGYHLKNMAEGLRLGRLSPRAGAVLGWIGSSIIFGLLHAGNPGASPIAIFNIFLAGLFLGLGVLLTGELAIGIGLHITWNLFEGNVFGFPVSGTGAAAPSLIAIHQGGPELMTGGVFGPEAGLVCILMILVGSGVILAWVHYRYGKVTLLDQVGEPPARPAPVVEPVAGAGQ